MLVTHPSIQGLAAVLECKPEIESGPPELGVVRYAVTYESESERVSLSVLPHAAEVQLGIVAKNPTRIFRLALADVSLVAATKDSDGTRVEINFFTAEFQTLQLSLKPVLFLSWGNQIDLPERHPPWERD